MSSAVFRWALGAVVTLCVSVAVAWALIVPTFQEPDELAHADYAFALYNVGHSFVVMDARPATIATHEVKALAQLGRFRALRYNQFAREPLSGMPLRLALGRDRPELRASVNLPERGAKMPYVMFSYPIGYYALLSFAMRLADPVTHGFLPAIFIAARLFNVALLIPTLVLASLAFLDAGLDRRTTLLATFAIGAFPLTSWVAGYIQPDNLSLLLITATLYVAMLWRSHPRSTWLALALAGIVSALFVTKHQYAVAAWLTVLFLVGSRLASRTIRSRVIVSLLAVSLLPIAAIFASLTWTPISRIVGTQRLAEAAVAQFGQSPAHLFSNTVITALLGVLDVYCGGTAFESFWFRFSFRAGALVVGNVHHILNFILIVLSLAFLVTFGSLVRTRWIRIARIGHKRTVAAAIHCLGSGIAMHLYVATTLILLSALIASDGRLELEGRYWLPTIVPAMVIVLAQVPRLIPSLRRRRVVVLSLASTMALSSGLASAIDLHNMYADFYVPSGVMATYVSVGGVEGVGNDLSAVDLTIPVQLDLDRPIYAHGFAIDMNTGYPARRVVVVIDGNREYRATTGLATPNLAEAYHDDAIRNSGFAVVLPSQTLSTGAHHLRFEIDDGRHARAMRVGRDIDIMAIRHVADRVN